MTKNEKAIANLANKDITAVETNNTVYVVIGDVQLELAEYEINFNAREYEETITYELKVSGNGTQEELINALRDLVSSLENSTSETIVKVDWEDSILVTSVKAD
jgi:hypothetical protein